MDKENLSGRVEKDLLERVRNKFPAGNKTESYRAAFIAALDCNTREHVPTVGLDESVTQIVEKLLQERNTPEHTSSLALQDIVTQDDIISMLKVRDDQIGGLLETVDLIINFISASPKWGSYLKQRKEEESIISEPPVPFDD